MEIYIFDDYRNDIGICQYHFSKNDSLIRSGELEAGDDVLFDSLESGVYTLKLRNGNDIDATFGHVVVAQDSLTSVMFSLDRYMEARKDRGYTDHKQEFGFGFLYGNNGVMEPARPEKNQQFMTKVGDNFYFTDFARHVAFGPYIGLSIAYSPFKKDTIKTLGQTIKRSYYFNASADFGLQCRFAAFNNPKRRSDGFKIDGGIVYSLPLLYRLNQEVGTNQIIQTKHIHRYNEFYVLARVAYRAFALQACYNLTTFLKTHYAEVPKYRLGLVFLIRSNE
ncbi:MAG: hypothetical protein JST26_15485 [Bacteroidetes bacterium]|nr:hypothetical protein [Bacteroidota bacterium]